MRKIAKYSEFFWITARNNEYKSEFKWKKMEMKGVSEKSDIRFFALIQFLNTLAGRSALFYRLVAL